MESNENVQHNLLVHNHGLLKSLCSRLGQDIADGRANFSICPTISLGEPSYLRIIGEDDHLQELRNELSGLGILKGLTLRMVSGEQVLQESYGGIKCSGEKFYGELHLKGPERLTSTDFGRDIISGLSIIANREIDKLIGSI